MAKKKTFTIKIRKEDLPKRRVGVKPSKVMKSKKTYRRKAKYAKKAE